MDDPSTFATDRTCAVVADISLCRPVPDRPAGMWMSAGGLGRSHGEACDAVSVRRFLMRPPAEAVAGLLARPRFHCSRLGQEGLLQGRLH